MPTDGLDCAAAVAALRSLEGRQLSVRIASRHHEEELIAVFHGRLGTMTSDAKQPSLFWPLGEPLAGHVEQPGLYLRERDFEHAARRAGEILVIHQASLIINVRPLEK